MQVHFLAQCSWLPLEFPRNSILNCLNEYLDVLFRYLNQCPTVLNYNNNNDNNNNNNNNSNSKNNNSDNIF